MNRELYIKNKKAAIDLMIIFKMTKLVTQQKKTSMIKYYYLNIISITNNNISKSSIIIYTTTTSTSTSLSTEHLGVYDKNIRQQCEWNLRELLCET